MRFDLKAFADMLCSSGFPITWGVFQTYFETHPPFKNQKHLAMVGTLTTVSSLVLFYTSVEDFIDHKREFPTSEQSSSHQSQSNIPSTNEP